MKIFNRDEYEYYFEASAFVKFKLLFKKKYFVYGILPDDRVHACKRLGEKIYILN